MTEINIGGRKIPLFYSTYELIEIQKEIGCNGHQLRDEVFGIVQEDEDDPMSIRLKCVKEGDRTEKLVRLIRILGNAGLEEQGEEPDLTDKWIMKHMKPGLIMIYAMAALAVITEGNSLELPESEENKQPVDEVLEEENAKKQPGN